MWYVNDAIYNAWFTKVYGFILTMWYVNSIHKLTLAVESLGFILTMWYVNNYRKTDTFMALVKFYINYVICKFICIYYVS